MTAFLKFMCLAICYLFVTGCDDKSDFKPVYDVPPDLQPFVDAFVQEANMRGSGLTITNLIIRYDDSIDDIHCAKCNSASLGNDVQKIISVNSTITCWITNQQLEVLFFHELGHCILGRDHDDGLLPEGSPRSIMVRDNLALYDPCIYAVDGDNSCNHLNRRLYYVDELFDSETPVPDWGK